MSLWKCNQCGEVHESVPSSFSFRAPIYWNPDASIEGAARTWIDQNFCIIRDEHFFIRGTLEIPIIESSEFFVFGVWSSLGAKNFERARAMALEPGRTAEPPNFGWLSNRLWQYPDTLNLKCKVISQSVGRRPLIELEPTDHPLAVEQRNGISQVRFVELSEQCLHGWKHPKSAV